MERDRVCSLTTSSLLYLLNQIVFIFVVVHFDRAVAAISEVKIDIVELLLDQRDRIQVLALFHRD